MFERVWNCDPWNGIIWVPKTTILMAHRCPSPPLGIVSCGILGFRTAMVHISRFRKSLNLDSHPSRKSCGWEQKSGVPRLRFLGNGNGWNWCPKLSKSSRNMETMAEMLPKAWDVWIPNLEGSSELRFLGICVLETGEAVVRLQSVTPVYKYLQTKPLGFSW